MSMSGYITPAYKVGNSKIAVLHVYTEKHGDQYKIMKECINYIRGKNVTSWRVMGTASTFDNLEACMTKFTGLVNKARKSRGLEPIRFRIED